MKYRLLALDLDGTLLDQNHRVPESTINKLRQAESLGVIVTLATGRMWPSTKMYAEELKLLHPLISYNGALLRAVTDDSEAQYHHISMEAMQDMIAYCKQRNLYLQLYADNEIVVEKCVEETLRDPDLMNAPCREVVDYSLYLASPNLRPTPKMMIRVPRHRVSEVPGIEAEIKRNFPQLNVVQSTPTLIELLSPDVSKGRALRLLSEQLGRAQAEVIAIGDGDNDISMVEWAGLGVAVQNASEALKASSNYITQGSTFLGVEEAIDKFILSPK